MTGYSGVPDTATQNTSTTGMHTDVLHVLNNDHAFHVTDKKRNLALTPIL